MLDTPASSYSDGCIDDTPHALYRAYIKTIYDEFGRPRCECFELRCQVCGECLNTFELDFTSHH